MQEIASQVAVSILFNGPNLRKIIHAKEFLVRTLRTHARAGRDRTDQSAMHVTASCLFLPVLRSCHGLLLRGHRLAAPPNVAHGRVAVMALPLVP